jgi:hypothetical protein
MSNYLSKKLRKALRNLPLLFLLVLMITSCQSPGKRFALKAQRNLNEVDLLLERREFRKAQTLAEQAKEEIEQALIRDPDNININLVHARASLTLFLANNTRTIEQSEIRPRSLVRIPSPQEYLGYEELKGSINKLEKMLTEQKLSFEQQGAANMLLAAIFRLDVASAPQAISAYGRALEAYTIWRTELQGENSRETPRIIATALVTNQIAQLQIGIAEVSLLLENWDDALHALQEQMGNNDLEYFEIRLDLLTGRLQNIQRMIDDNFNSDNADIRSERLKEYIRENRTTKLSLSNQLGSYNSNEAALLQTEVDLVETKNNLIYRIICYYNLAQEHPLQKARTILRTFDPTAEQQLISLLQQSKPTLP